MAEIEKNIGESRMSEEPKKPMKFMLSERCVKEKHLADDAVTTRVIKDKNVTPEKLSNSVQEAIVTPITNQLDSKYSNITSSLDKKFTNKTNELYSMIRSLQVGGIALSNQFGDRNDIGITQKTLTKALGKFWEEMESITHKTYMDFTLTVVPPMAYTEIGVDVTIKADCSGSISNFDSIKIYIDNVLVAESSDIEVFTTSVTLDKTSMVRAEGMILGKIIIKEQEVFCDSPFFMGSGMAYQDVMITENHREISGSSLEGDYDLTVKHDGEHMFIIIPASRKGEFRRANMKTPDMGGYEIPLYLDFENEDYVVYRSSAENGYLAGTYNIDIDVDS